MTLHPKHPARERDTRGLIGSLRTTLETLILKADEDARARSAGVFELTGLSVTYATGLNDLIEEHL